MKKNVIIIILIQCFLLSCVSPIENPTKNLEVTSITAKATDLISPLITTIIPQTDNYTDQLNFSQVRGLTQNSTPTPLIDNTPFPTFTPAPSPVLENLLLIDKTDYWLVTSVEIHKEIDVLGYKISPVWHNYPITNKFLLIKFDCLTGKSLIELYTGKDMGLTFVHNAAGYKDVYILDHEAEKFTATLIGESWLAFPIPPEKHGFTLVFRNSPPIELSEVQPLSWRLDQIFFVTERNGNPDIYSMNPDGTSQNAIINHPSIDKEPSVSPDGGSILFSSDREGNFDIYQFRMAGNLQKNITNHPAEDGAPSWSPDGNDIVFHSTRNGNWDIIKIDKDGNHIKILFEDMMSSEKYPSFSYNGKEIAFQSDREGNWDIFISSKNGDQLRQITHHPSQDIRPSWSPVLSQIVFWSDRDGHWRLFTVDIETLEISPITEYANPGSYISKPSWSPDGKYIVFSIIRDGNQEIFLSNQDGSDPRRLTNDFQNDYDPNW